ncbi:MAG: hypothetical protein WA890_19565 [Micromonospora sp.]
MAVAVDLVKGALDAHLQQGFDMRMSDRRAIRRGMLIAGAMWLGLSVEIFLSNVVFPSKSDEDGISLLVSYLCIFAALFLTGVLAARDGAGRKGQVLTGLVAGAMIGTLTVATFALVDNVWLDIVAHQQAKIDGFAHSGAASMREYINDGLVGAAVFLTVALGVFGAALSLFGGLVGREPPSSSSAMAVKRTRS